MTLARGWTVTLAALAGLSVAAAPAAAQDTPVKIGVTISTTGPAAALGVPERNTIELIPKEIDGTPLEFIVLDDGGDPSAATSNARRLATEENVDILVGSSITPASIAVANVAAETARVHFALAPMPVGEGHAKWSMVMPQRVSLMASALFEHMQKNGVKTLGLIGFNDSWGDLWADEVKANGGAYGIELVADERYARTDTSVAGQALKLVSQRPDAVLVGASGTAAALPQIALRERGYQGPIYQTHGAVTHDFIRIAGDAGERAILVSGPVVIAEKQPDDAPTKKPGLDYVGPYEEKHGPNTRTQFGAHMYDVYKVLERAVPIAAAKAGPGTPEFREALIEALNGEEEIAASQGVYNFTPEDRYGLDERARVLITVKDGDWAILE